MIHQKVIFEFRRRFPDDVAYSFVQCGEAENKVWKRVDMELWVKKLEKLGWACVNEENKVFALPWACPVEEQGDIPPACIWISRKLDKSYVYDLVYL